MTDILYFLFLEELFIHIINHISKNKKEKEENGVKLGDFLFTFFQFTTLQSSPTFIFSFFHIIIPEDYENNEWN